jgi:integrase/recombinase XerC
MLIITDFLYTSINRRLKMEHARNFETLKAIKTPKQQLIKTPKSTIKKRSVFPEYIEQFAQYLGDCNYSPTTIDSYKIKVRRILNDFMKINNSTFNFLKDFNAFSLEKVVKIERIKLKQIEDREIKPASAHTDMKAFRAFLKFLFLNGIISYKYEIPNTLLAPTTRANLYFEQEDINTLAESIRKNKNPIRRTRSYALLLLYIETGCRPIEASNVLLEDINFSERTIRLFSIKSGTRKLDLDPYVINALKNYLKLREELSPLSNHFFLKNDGNKTTTSYLNSLLSSENKKAFGKCKIHGRGLRHTYVTNAFENNNSFQDIADTMGHKHWVSTLHYQHRSKQRLLENTLPFNPIPEILNTGDDNNAYKRS